MTTQFVQIRTLPSASTKLVYLAIEFVSRNGSLPTKDPMAAKNVVTAATINPAVVTIEMITTALNMYIIMEICFATMIGLFPTWEDMDVKSRVAFVRVVERVTSPNVIADSCQSFS